jgi:hypothetical protein
MLQRINFIQHHLSLHATQYRHMQHKYVNLPMTLGTISSKSSKMACFFLLLGISSRFSEFSAVSTEVSDLLLLFFEHLRKYY